MTASTAHYLIDPSCVPRYYGTVNRAPKAMTFDLHKYVEDSTTKSGVPLKIKDKAILRRIAHMLK